MRKTFGLIAIVCAIHLTSSAQNVKTPAPSPTTQVKQDFGLSSIEINYSRPTKKGRKIFGDLVPFGKVWRTGANSATTLQFGDPVTIGGVLIPAGKYGLLSIPDAKNWTLIITKQTNVTSPAAYVQDQDIVRVSVPVTAIQPAVENFTIQVNNITPNACNILIQWDNTQVALPITTDIDSRIMADIEKGMQSEKKPYFAAAVYYMDNQKDLNKALEWFTIACNESPKAYWVWYQKALCLSKLGKKAEAIETAQKSILLAKDGKNDDYVVLNENLIKSLK